MHYAFYTILHIIFTDVPDGFEWNGDRWMWSEDSGHTNYNLPDAIVEDDNDK